MKFLLFLLLFPLVSHAQIITTIAGTGAGSFSGDGIAATSAAVFNPYDVGMDSLGNLYIGDVGNNRIRKINTAGIISTVAGNGVAGYNGDAIIATTAKLNFPYGMAVNRAGTIVISDMDNHRIRSIQTEAGGLIMTIAGTGVVGYSGDGGPAVSAQINSPQGIFWDASYNVYFSDALNNRVRKIDPLGTITTIAGNGAAASGGDGGPATAAQVNHPSGVTADSVGNIYIAEMMGHRIRRISTTGIITTVAGNGSVGSGGDGGPATAASLRYPKGVCIDRLGNIIIADSDNQRIRKIDIITGIITTIAGTGSVGYSGDGGPATAAKLNYLQGVYVDNAGSIYTGDCLNNRIRKITCVPPVAGSLSGLDTVCMGSSITLTATMPGGSWSCSNPRATVTTAGVVSGVTTGLDTVIYSVANSCASAQVIHPVYIKPCATTFSALTTATGLKIYPNPATNELTITNTEKIHKVTITDRLGHIIHAQRFDAEIVQIDIAHLPKGIYFVKVDGMDGNKFIKM